MCDVWLCFSFIFDRHTFSSGTNHLWNFIWTYLSYIPSFVHLLLSLSISFSLSVLSLFHRVHLFVSASYHFSISSHLASSRLIRFSGPSSSVSLSSFLFLSSFFFLTCYHHIRNPDIQSRQTKPIRRPRRHVYIHLLSHKYKYITRLHLASCIFSARPFIVHRPSTTYHLPSPITHLSTYPHIVHLPAHAHSSLISLISHSNHLPVYLSCGIFSVTVEMRKFVVQSYA